MNLKYFSISQLFRNWKSHYFWCQKYHWDSLKLNICQATEQNTCKRTVYHEHVISLNAFDMINDFIIFYDTFGMKIIKISLVFWFSLQISNPWAVIVWMLTMLKISSISFWDRFEWRTPKNIKWSFKYRRLVSTKYSLHDFI